MFKLPEGSQATVRHTINELYRQAEILNSTDVIVSALLSGLNMGIIINAALMNDVGRIQQIFKDLFTVIGNTSGSSYGAIARAMEQLTGVWNETIGPEEDFEDAKEEVEESLNWFQRIIKKIKDFFKRIFGIFR